MSLLKQLFQKKSVREMESKLRFRRGKARIQKYVQEARRSAERYRQLASDAYRLGDTEQFRLIGSHYLRLRHTITRWERFLVKLEALELRRNEVSATKDFLVSIDALTTSINRGASVEEISRMQGEIEQAIEKSRAQEEMLDVAMEAAGGSMFEEVPHQEAMLGELELGFSAERERNTATPSSPALRSPGPGNSSARSSRSPQGQQDPLDRDIEAALLKLDTPWTRPGS